MIIKKKSSSITFVFKLFICVLGLIFVTSSYVDKQNKLTEIRRIIPKLEREVKHLTEENRRLHYEIDRFENPLHLMELARQPEFSHLRFPRVDEVVVIEPHE